MKPQLFALLTAIAWGVGSYFEKKGLLMGNLAPQVGITIRTFVALFILSLVSVSQWKTIPQAGPKALLYLVIGGGVLAGSVGLLLFYMAIKSAPLGRVMPIAFTSPLFGALLGFLLANEPITIKSIVGILLTVGGIVLLTIG